MFHAAPIKCYFRLRVNTVDRKHLLISVYCSQPSKVTFKRVFTFKGIHQEKTKKNGRGNKYRQNIRN